MNRTKICRLALAGMLNIVGGVGIFGPIQVFAAENHQTVPAGREKTLAAASVFGRDLLFEAAGKFAPGKVATDTRNTGFVVLGEVNCPGEFELPGEVNVLSALLAAGGPGKNGSLRYLQVRLGEQLLGELDLYDYLLGGSLKNNFVLNGGEVIVVPAAGPTIKASGKLRRAGIFELKLSEMCLDKVVLLCGGVSASDSGCRIEILREIGGYRRVFMAIELEAGEPVPSVSLLPGDEVAVLERSFNQNPIVLEGCVVGKKVPYRDGIRLSDVIGDGACFEPDAALEYAEVLRKGVDGEVYEVIGFVPEKLTSDLTGDFSLRPSDRIVIFSQDFLNRNPVVFVEGAVKVPGRFGLSPEMDIKKVIAAAGGLGDGGESLGAELSRREIQNGRLVLSRSEVNLRAALHDDPRHNLKLKPFDSLRIYKP